MSAEILPPGKLDSHFLTELLKEHRGVSDPDVVLGPGEGEDAAIIRIPPGYLLVSAIDPITFPTPEPGGYAVHVNANDVATRGGIPRWFKSTALFPAGWTTRDHVRDVLTQISTVCKDFNTAIVGGHTEVTDAVNRIVVSGVMDGIVEEGREVRTSGAEVGDDIILTKGIAIEGISIIASEKYSELQARGYSEEFLRRSRAFNRTPGLSVVKEALIAHKVGVNSMHDPTEGGISNGLAEIARASHNGILVWREKIPVLPEAEQLCKEFGLDPMGTIASGALLITTSPKNRDLIIAEMEAHGIPAFHIGQVMPESFGLQITDNPTSRSYRDLSHSATDEITKLFEVPQINV